MVIFRWNQERLDYLIRNYTTKTNQEIAAHLGTEDYIVRNRAHKHKLYKDKNFINQPGKKKQPRKFVDLNNGWTSIVVKLNKLNKQREITYAKIEKETVFSEYMKLRHELDRLNRHIEVIETITDDRKTEIYFRQTMKEYAVHS